MNLHDEEIQEVRHVRDEGHAKDEGDEGYEGHEGHEEGEEDMTAFKHHPTGDMGIEGADLDAGGFIPLFFSYAAASADSLIAVMPRAMRVRSIIVRPTVAGTDAGAVNVAVRKVPSGTAIASGTAVHTGTGDLKGTINTNQTLAVSSTDAAANVAAGEAIALDFTGVLTAAIGGVTIMLNPR